MNESVIIIIGGFVLSALGIIVHGIRKSACLGVMCESRAETLPVNQSPQIQAQLP
jgi:hypothetical protein